MRIARIMGVDLVLHWSLAIWPALIIGDFIKSGKLDELGFNVTYFAVVFILVTVHEYAHTFMLLRYGCGIKKIYLFALGGAAAAEEIPEIPRQEILIAIAGPLSNLVIGLLSLGICIAAYYTKVEWLFFASALSVGLNVLMAVFNLIPAFPLDGGRVFRALLARKMTRSRATWLAATVSQIIAVSAGIWILTAGREHMINMLVVVFVILGSEAEARQTAKKARESRLAVVKTQRQAA